MWCSLIAYVLGGNNKCLKKGLRSHIQDKRDKGKETVNYITNLSRIEIVCLIISHWPGDKATKIPGVTVSERNWGNVLKREENTRKQKFS